MPISIDGIRETLTGYGRDDLETRLPLVAALLGRHRAAKAAVDVERAKLVTDYMRRAEGSGEPITVKRAKALAHYLSNRVVVFHDANLLGGSTTSKELGAPLYPEFFGLSIWPELDTIGSRGANPQGLSEDEAAVLNRDVFPWWLERTIIEQVRKEDPFGQSLAEKMVLMTLSKAATISHTTPCYDLVLKKGLEGIVGEARAKERESAGDAAKRDFYRSVQIAMNGVSVYAKRISQEAARKARTEADRGKKIALETIAETLSSVPDNPARSYLEAVQSLWLCHVAVLAENSNMALNPGRIDQILYPFFRRDMESGRLSVERALEITACLWFKLADNVNLVPEAAERLFGGAGAVPAITLGGVDAEGKDAVNELTYLMLKVTELLPIRDPNVNARFHPDANPREYRDEVSRVVLSTRAIPAFYNDVENIAALVNQGESLEHARDYAVIGCVELGSAGRDYSASSSIFMMLYTVLYMALHNGRTPVTGDAPLGPATGEVESFRSMSDVLRAYDAQLSWMVDTTVKLNNLYGRVHQRNLPTPILSGFFEGPMEKGRDLVSGGATYNASGVTFIGFADVVDSLNAIEAVCFTEDAEFKATLRELVDAVDGNFEGRDRLWAYVRNCAPKYGTAHPVAVRNADALVKLHYERFNGKENYRGGNYRVAYWTMTNHAGYGKVSPALPSGRKAGVVFSSGITPVSQIGTDLTTALSAVARLDSRCIPGAYALNMKYSPTEIFPQSIDRFGGVVEAYFREGGQQVQFNIQDYRTLEEAKAHPEKHPHLLVRVSGYSAYFSSLNDAMKDELITRSQYSLGSGQLVKLEPLPQSFVDPAAGKGGDA